jgi:hypothetical protein
MQNYNFSCGSVWVWNLVSDIKGHDVFLEMDSSETGVWCAAILLCEAAVCQVPDIIRHKPICCKKLHEFHVTQFNTSLWFQNLDLYLYIFKLLILSPLCFCLKTPWCQHILVSFFVLFIIAISINYYVRPIVSSVLTAIFHQNLLPFLAVSHVGYNFSVINSRLLVLDFNQLTVYLCCHYLMFM